MSAKRDESIAKLRKATAHQPTSLDDSFYVLTLTIAEVRELLAMLDEFANYFTLQPVETRVLETGVGLNALHSAYAIKNEFPDWLVMDTEDENDS